MNLEGFRNFLRGGLNPPNPPPLGTPLSVNNEIAKYFLIYIARHKTHVSWHQLANCWVWTPQTHHLRTPLILSVHSEGLGGRLQLIVCKILTEYDNTNVKTSNPLTRVFFDVTSNVSFLRGSSTQLRDVTAGPLSDVTPLQCTAGPTPEHHGRTRSRGPSHSFWVPIRCHVNALLQSARLKLLVFFLGTKCKFLPSRWYTELWLLTVWILLAPHSTVVLISP